MTSRVIPVPYIVRLLALAFVGVGALCAHAGSVTGRPWELWAAALCLMIAGALSLVRNAAHAEPAALAAVSVGGTLGALLSMRVEPFAVYPHLDPSGSATPLRLAIVALVALQLSVIVACMRARPGPLHALRSAIARSRARALLLLIVIGFASAVPTRDLLRSGIEVALATTSQLLALLTAYLFASAIPDGLVSRAGDALTRRLSLPGAPRVPHAWDRLVPLGTAAAATLITASIAWLVFDGVPHIDDSVSYLFSAKVFAAGSLSLPAPPDSAAFHVDEVLVAGERWFGYGFPGWPALLSLGVRLGAPWLVNPILAGCMVWLAHAYVRRVEDMGTAHVVAILLAISPWLWFMSGELMPHPLAAILVLGALYAVERGIDEGAGWLALSGIGLGACALVRPLDAALAAGLVTLRVVARVGWRASARRLSPVVATSAAVAALVLPYNRALTGRATYTPQMMWTDRRWGVGADRFGFGRDVGIRAWDNIDPLPGHGVVDVLMNLNKNLFITQSDLLGWSLGSLTFVLAALVLPALTGDERRRPRWWSAWLAAFVVGYSAYWFSGGPDLGARYWYPAIVPLVVLTVWGARRLSRGMPGKSPGMRVAAAATLASVGALLAFVPSQSIRKYHGYRGIGGEIRELARSQRLEGALVLVAVPEREVYQSAFSLNRIPLSSAPVVFARDSARQAPASLLRAFPGRQLWYLERDSETRTLRLKGVKPGGP